MRKHNILLMILPLVGSLCFTRDGLCVSLKVWIFSDLSNSSWMDLNTSSKPGSGNTDTNLTATRSLKVSSKASENHPVLCCKKNKTNKESDHKISGLTKVKMRELTLQVVCLRGFLISRWMYSSSSSNNCRNVWHLKGNNLKAQMSFHLGFDL